MKITNKFFIDTNNPGIVRGGFYDEMGGVVVSHGSILVGRAAQYVCDALNAYRLQEEIEV